MILVPEITIVETAPYHLRLMSDAMQSKSSNMAYRLGMTPLKALWKNYRQSLICKSVFINGNLCAIFGLMGTVFSDVGTPWICMTPEVEQHPMRVAFRFRKELDNMAKMFPVLEDWLEETNDTGMRFMSLMGFSISKNKVQVGDVVFRKAERRA